MRVVNDKNLKMNGRTLFLSDFLCASCVFLAVFLDGPKDPPPRFRIRLCESGYVSDSGSSVLRRALSQEERDEYNDSVISSPAG